MVFNVIVSLGLVLMVIYVLVVPKGQCADMILKEVTGSKSFFSYIPFYNSYSIRLSITNSAKAVGIISAVCSALFMLCVIERIFNTFSQLLALIATVTLVVVIAVSYIIDIMNIFLIAALVDDLKLKKWALFPPLAYYMSIKRVKIYFRRNKDIVKGTFNGD